MTLLHQAAQKAVEALTAVKFDKSFCCLKEERTQEVVLASIAALESALQQQEVPAFDPAKHNETTYPLGQHELPREPVAERWIVALETAVQIPGKRMPTLGYTVFADSQSFDSADAASAFIRENNLPLGWVRMEASRTPWRDLCAASPSTTRQQEAGSGSSALVKDILEHINDAPNEADCALCDGRGMYGFPGGRCRFCDGTGRVKWRSTPKDAAAPSTPESAGGVPDGVNAHGEGQR